ncbi:MAG: hypothetical protein Q9197_001796 [Variospora fuerteventurae]
MSPCQDTGMSRTSDKYTSQTDSLIRSIMRDRDLLNIECCVADTDHASTTASDIAPVYNNIGECIFLPASAQLSHVQSIEIVDIWQKDNHGAARTSTPLADVELQVHTFRLHNLPATALELEEESRSLEVDADEDIQETQTLHAQVKMLPHVDLQGAWESTLTNTKAVSLSRRQLTSNLKSFNRLVLLYGPPGTGKSTLCRALAQKLAIRMGQHYIQTKLVEIDAAALFSKFFGESSKLVSRTFAKIEKLLHEEPNVFLCIMVDEIESLASRRQHSTGSNEPKDSMRDLAILDRIDVRIYLPGPSTKTRYEIFRRCYLDLFRCDILAPNQQRPRDDVDALDISVGTRPPETWGVVARPSIDYEVLPTLWRIAERSAGLSGRVLQRLPLQALAMYVHYDPCSIDEALDALSRIVEERQLASFNPTQIFADDVTEEKGENARLSAFVGAIAVGDLVKSTLGPKGMDKILQSASTGEIMVTNDGATILKSIALDNAAAKVLVNISKVQDDEVGDGTTSVTVLAAELLREAEKLVERKIHPQTIIEGYRIARNVALDALAKTAQDHSTDRDLFRKDLLAIARTTLSSKVLSQDRDHFATLACDAVLRMRGSTDLSHIQIIKKAGGKLSDSYLDEGFILDKRIGVNQPKRLEKAKILVANTAMDTDKVKIFGARVKVDSTGGLAKLEEAEREKMKQKVEKIKAHGINCFVNRQLIYNRPEQLFSDAGIVSIEHADFDGIERLALVTGGEIASTFDHPELVQLGHCDLIEEIIIGEDTLIKFSGVAAGQACTIVLRGATEQLLDEAERSLHDALAVLSQTVRDPKTTLGGGCAEMVMVKAVEQEAPNVAGKKALAVGSFAAALQQLPSILADNAGFDSSELVTRLKKEMYEGRTSSGLDLLIPGGGIANMREKGVIESYKLKRAVVSSASEAAELLLRVDSIVRCAPRRRERT